MPSLANHSSNEFTKLLLIGDSKSGKTGSLTSLVAAGYHIRVLDLDNLLEPLKNFVLKECPDMIDNVTYRTLRDKRKATAAGPVIDGTPKAFVDASKMIFKWEYTEPNGEKVDLGNPSEWGSDCILVIDSLSRLCDAAYDWAEPLAPRGKGGDFDPRAVYSNAQDAVETFIATITGEAFATNVIVIAHVQYMDLPDGTKKGFPQGVGQALSPKIPQYFPSVVLYTNKGGKRTLQTTSTPLVDLANPKPFAMEKSYPIETGLADFFAVLREPPVKNKVMPKLVRRV